jgi:uncharacterized membrane protein YagU involved in acid resistance
LRRSIHWRAAAYAGIVAGVFSTLVQLALWAAFTDALPGILYRDARLAAALVLGAGALSPPETFDFAIMAVATIVHFALSIVYALALAAFIERSRRRAAWLVGAIFGAALYALNLHAFTLLFAWFTVARGAITLAAHVAFGVSAAVTYRRLRT